MNRREELEREIKDLKEKISEVRRDIRDCDSQLNHYKSCLDEKNNEFRDEHYDAKNDHLRDTTYNESSNDISREGFELLYRKYDANVQYEEEASDIKDNLKYYQDRLKELKAELHEYEQDLQIKNEELLNLPHEQEETPYRENYEEPINYDNKQYDDNRDEREGYFYKPTPNKPKQNNSSHTRLIQKNDEYKLHRTGLYEYAKLSNKEYKELRAVSGGYRASVGNTIFDYHNPNDLVISNSNGVPSIDDFKTIFTIEKKSGRMIMPIENISNKEYMARLIIGAFEAGLALKGNFKIPEKEVQKLSPDTKKKYQEHIKAYELKIAKRQEMIKKAYGK